MVIRSLPSLSILAYPCLIGLYVISMFGEYIVWWFEGNKKLSKFAFFLKTHTIGLCIILYVCFGMEIPKDYSSSHNIHSLIVNSINEQIKNDTSKKNILHAATKDISTTFSKKEENINSIDTEHILSQIDVFEAKNEFYAQ